MSDSIKFNHGDDNSISTNNGDTSLSDIFLVAALSHTSKMVYPNGEEPTREYATDHKGLVTAVDRSEQIISSLNSGITAISSVMAYSNPEDITDYAQDIMWLISGLSSLANEVHHSSQNMQFSLEQSRKQQLGGES